MKGGGRETEEVPMLSNMISPIVELLILCKNYAKWVSHG